MTPPWIPHPEQRRAEVRRWRDKSPLTCAPPVGAAPALLERAADQPGQICVAARGLVCREYDLYGYDPFGRPDHLYAGISRFKQQFGGTRRDSIGARDCIFYDRLAERLVAQLQGQTLVK